MLGTNPLLPLSRIKHDLTKSTRLNLIVALNAGEPASAEALGPVSSFVMDNPRILVPSSSDSYLWSPEFAFCVSPFQRL